MMSDLINRPRLTLLVTDSGLGGLSICARMVRHLTDQGSVGDLSVIYFNAWPYPDRGYNFLADDAERRRIFGNAITAMNRYRPDLIVIACNTLSILFKQGNLEAITPTPVVNIIHFGVEMIAAALVRYPRSKVLILGTKTTIASGQHKALLIQQGIPADRIAQQHCHGLAGAIEHDPNGNAVKTLVDQYLAAAAAAVSPASEAILAALCCTHYGYIQDLIKARLAHFTGAQVHIIDPNRGMSDAVAITSPERRFPAVQLEIKVVSRVPLPKQKIKSISSMVAATSPQTAQALRDYAHLPKLFSVEGEAS